MTAHETHPVLLSIFLQLLQWISTGNGADFNIFPCKGLYLCI